MLLWRRHQCEDYSLGHHKEPAKMQPRQQNSKHNPSFLAKIKIKQVKQKSTLTAWATQPALALQQGSSACQVRGWIIRSFKFLVFCVPHAAQLALGGWIAPALLTALQSCGSWIPARSCCPSARTARAPGLCRHCSRRARMQTDTPRLARICYRVLQSGQKHLLRKTAVTAHTQMYLDSVPIFPSCLPGTSAR